MKKPVTLLFPHSMAGAEAAVRRRATVLNVEYIAEGTKMKVIADDEIVGRYKEYIQNDD